MKNHNHEFIHLVNDAKTRIKEIDLNELNSWQKNQKPFVLIDVREESEFAQGAIPHAIHLGKGIIERDIEKLIPDKNSTLVLYCGGGYRSALACDNIQKMGYKNAYSLIGGYGSWLNR